jgi:hypothetical protein
LRCLAKERACVAPRFRVTRPDPHWGWVGGDSTVYDSTHAQRYEAVPEAHRNPGKPPVHPLNVEKEDKYASCRLARSRRGPKESPDVGLRPPTSAEVPTLGTFLDSAVYPVELIP